MRSGSECAALQLVQSRVAAALRSCKATACQSCRLAKERPAFLFLARNSAFTLCMEQQVQGFVGRGVGAAERSSAREAARRQGSHRGRHGPPLGSLQRCGDGMNA
jgi:hypothetical protein